MGESAASVIGSLSFLRALKTSTIALPPCKITSARNRKDEESNQEDEKRSREIVVGDRLVHSSLRRIPLRHLGDKFFLLDLV